MTPGSSDEGKYKNRRIALKMPDFGLKEEEIESLVVMLSGLREEKVSGRHLIARLTEKERNDVVEGGD